MKFETIMFYMKLKNQIHELLIHMKSVSCQNPCQNSGQNLTTAVREHTNIFITIKKLGIVMQNKIGSGIMFNSALVS